MTKPNLPTMADEILRLQEENERLKKKVEAWKKTFECLENLTFHYGGHPARGESVLLREYARACEKHPVFAENSQHALSVIEAELNELKHAVAHESLERQRAEAMDVAVTAIRFWLGEHI